MDPASVYSFSRSKYISANWSSSVTATLVSCGVEDTNSSLDIHSLRPGHMPGKSAGRRRGDNRGRVGHGRVVSQCRDSSMVAYAGNALPLETLPWGSVSSPKPLQSAYDFEKSSHLGIPGLWPLSNTWGRYPPGNAF